MTSCLRLARNSGLTVVVGRRLEIRDQEDDAAPFAEAGYRFERQPNIGALALQARKPGVLESSAECGACLYAAEYRVRSDR